jgi:hypothetical protein
LRGLTLYFLFSSVEEIIVKIEVVVVKFRDGFLGSESAIRKSKFKATIMPMQLYIWSY